MCAALVCTVPGPVAFYFGNQPHPPIARTIGDKEGVLAGVALKGTVVKLAR
jgi:hypothetical protein